MTIGIVAEIDQEAEGIRVTLEDGGSVLLPNAAEDLTGAAEVGRLLIAGAGRPAAPDGVAWYAAVRALPSGCFDLPANGEIRNSRMATSLGISLPLSDEWQEAETTFVQSPTVGFCLDVTGAVLGTYANSQR